MKTYKTLEREPKIFGLRERELVLMFILIMVLLIVINLLDRIGIKTGIYGFLAAVNIWALIFYILKKANEKKCPNFLDAYISYHLGNTKNIDPHCPKLKKSK